MQFRPRPQRKLLFAIIAALSALLILEGVLQLYRLISPSRFLPETKFDQDLVMSADEDLIWKLPPGDRKKFDAQIHINALGMRGAKPADPNPGDTYRIFYLGDSSVFGHGVPQADAFPWLAEKLLQQQGRKVETINGAVPGYSSQQCRILFDRYIDNLKPDALVLAPFWSDMMQMPWTDREIVSRSKKRWFAFPAFLRKSALIDGLSALVGKITGAGKDRRLVLESIFRYNPDNPDAKNLRVSPEQHLDNLRYMVIQSKKRGIDVTLLILPTNQSQAGQGVQQRLIIYQGNYRKTAEEFGATLLDGNEVFARVPEKEHIYLFMDMVHPSLKGHRVLASALAKSLTDSYLRK